MGIWEEFQCKQEFSLTLCAALVSLLRRGLVWGLRDGAYSHPYHGLLHGTAQLPLGFGLGEFQQFPQKRRMTPGHARAPANTASNSHSDSRRA